MKYRGAHQTSVESWIKRAYVGAVVAYAILALAFVAVAYGQTRQSTIPLPTYTFLRPPSGSSDVVVERYFEYLNLQSVGNLTESYFPNWVGLIEAFGYGAVFLIILYFFVYAWFARRRTGDLYPVEVYNGYITERGGPVDPFNWATYTILVSYMVYYSVVNILYGQMY
jgi:hypothetical protein